MNKSSINDYAVNNRTAIVDIVPTICQFLNIDVPEKTKLEFDGVPLMDNELKAFNLSAEIRESDILEVRWDIVNESVDGKGIVMISYSNDLSKGGEDKYIPLGEVELKEKKATFKISPLHKKQDFCKVVLKSGDNSINYWVYKKY